MPFQSKAQQRMMFAKHPQIAKRWAAETEDIKSLPEKVESPMSKKAGTGRFFRDLEGRESGMFMGKLAQGMSAASSSAGGSAMGVANKPIAQTDQSQLNIGATGAPMGGSGFRGQGMGGGMYGTGDGEGVNDESDSSYGTGKPAMKKKAAGSPSDWDADTGLATGFHRPAREQPEALEEGGERFHSTESNSVVPPSNRQRHGLVEGGNMTVRATSSPQMGKHASVSRFMGTSYGIEKSAWDSDPTYYQKSSKSSPSTGSWIGDRASEYKGSLGRAAGGVANTASEGIKSITSSPVAATIGTLLAARLGYGGMKRLFRGGRKALPVSRAVSGSLKGGGGSMVDKLMRGAGSLVDRAKNYVTK